MEQRLNCIYDIIRQGVGVVDVGTDHGYLPVRLALEGYAGNLFASDIRPGPLSAARRSAQQAAVSERIRFLLCDGLDACPPDQVDTIVIAGMGGDAICGILDRAEWCMDAKYRLILQPMTKAEVLRYWLCNNGFQITEETLCRERDTVYQLLVAAYCGSNERLTDSELFLGKRKLADPALYRAILEKEIARIKRRQAGLLNASSPDHARELAALEAYLRELLSVRETL